jgi:hypothetical protein
VAEGRGGNLVNWYGILEDLSNARSREMIAEARRQRQGHAARLAISREDTAYALPSKHVVSSTHSDRISTELGFGSRS